MRAEEFRLITRVSTCDRLFALLAARRSFHPPPFAFCRMAARRFITRINNHYERKCLRFIKQKRREGTAKLYVRNRHVRIRYD